MNTESSKIHLKRGIKVFLIAMYDMYTHDDQTISRIMLNNMLKFHHLTALKFLFTVSC